MYLKDSYIYIIDTDETLKLTQGQGHISVNVKKIVWAITRERMGGSWKNFFLMISYDYGQSMRGKTSRSNTQFVTSSAQLIFTRRKCPYSWTRIKEEICLSHFLVMFFPSFIVFWGHFLSMPLFSSKVRMIIISILHNLTAIVLPNPLDIYLQYTSGVDLTKLRIYHVSETPFF